MALTGSMKDFGVSEILQLIGLQKKTGVLTITDKKRKVEILFEQGNIVKAEHQPEQDLFDLGATLIRSGLAPAGLVQAAKTEAQRTVKPLPQALLSQKAIDQEALTSVISLIHREIVYSLFLWKEGDYSFDQQAQASYVHQWTQPIASEGVLMDGYRIKDEWPLVERVIPDLEARLAMTPGEFGPDDRLHPDEKAVYQLIDGSRTVWDVVFMSRMGMFETLKIVKELIEKGRAVAVAREESEVRAAPSRSRTLPVAGIALLCLGALLTLFGTYRNLGRIVWPDLGNPSVEAGELVEAGYRSERVSTALTLFAALHGRYPESLDELHDSGLWPGGPFSTAFGPMRYQPEKGGKSCSLEAVPAPDSGGN